MFFEFAIVFSLSDSAAATQHRTPHTLQHHTMYITHSAQHTTHTTYTTHSVAILAQVGTLCRGSGLGPLLLSAVSKCDVVAKLVCTGCLSIALSMSHHNGSGFGLGGSVAAWTEFDYGNSMTEVFTPLLQSQSVLVELLWLVLRALTISPW